MITITGARWESSFRTIVAGAAAFIGEEADIGNGRKADIRSKRVFRLRR
jgi:hypothetical protein